MYTVIIADSQDIEKLQEYRLFLEPFTNSRDFKICEWFPGEGDSLELSVPSLGSTVANVSTWRAIILCPDDGIHQENPFDLTDYSEPSFPYETIEDESEEEEGYTEKRINALKDYYKQRYEERAKALRQAAENPLTKLSVRLLEDPLVSKAGDVSDIDLEFEPDDEKEKAVSWTDTTIDNLELQEYRLISKLKKELRGEIRGTERRNFNSPAEVFCIAKRTFPSNTYDPAEDWTEHDETRYSRFYERNLYYDKQRYLIFDMSEQDKPEYTSDYIRYLSTAMILAAHDVPQGSISPNRVYRLNCVTDDEKLSAYLTRYKRKLEATLDLVRSGIRKESEVEIQEFTDREAERLFSREINIPVTWPKDAETGLLQYRQSPGLFNDRPTEERSPWLTFQPETQKRLHRLLKQPERAVSRAAENLRKSDRLEDDRAVALNHYQVEDIQEHVNKEESEMVSSMINGMHDEAYYLSRQREFAEEVDEVMKHRMNTRTAIIAGSCVLGAALISLVPVFFAKKDGAAVIGQTALLLILLAAALALILGAAWLTAFLERRELTKAISAYNGKMNGLKGEMDNNMSQYSRLLSHICNVMRGNSVVELRERLNAAGSRRLSILKSHESGILERCAVLEDVFGRFMLNEPVDIGMEEIEPYKYNFDRAQEYGYDIPKDIRDAASIEYIQKGNHIDLPISYFKKISLIRVELFQ